MHNLCLHKCINVLSNYIGVLKISIGFVRLIVIALMGKMQKQDRIFTF